MIDKQSRTGKEGQGQGQDNDVPPKKTKVCKRSPHKSY